MDNTLGNQGPIADFVRGQLNQGLAAAHWEIVTGPMLALAGTSITKGVQDAITADYQHAIDEVVIEKLYAHEGITTLVLPKPRFAGKIFRPRIRLIDQGIKILSIGSSIAQVQVTVSNNSLKKHPSDDNNTKTLGAMPVVDVVNKKPTKRDVHRVLSPNTSLSDACEYLVYISSPTMRFALLPTN